MATGLHLKEYTGRELSRLMRGAGFSRVLTFVAVRGRTVTAPIAAARSLEAAVRATGPAGRRLAHTRSGTMALGNRIAAVK